MYSYEKDFFIKVVSIYLMGSGIYLIVKAKDTTLRKTLTFMGTLQLILGYFVFVDAPVIVLNFILLLTLILAGLSIYIIKKLDEDKFKRVGYLNLLSCLSFLFLLPKFEYKYIPKYEYTTDSVIPYKELYEKYTLDEDNFYIELDDNEETFYTPEPIPKIWRGIRKKMKNTQSFVK